MQDLVEKAANLVEALPYMRRFVGSTIVIKYGGHAMADESLRDSFAIDVVLLKQIGLRPVVIHGGGPQIASALEKMGRTSKFVDGLRVTDEATVEIAEMVLSGAINKQIVAAIHAAGGRALGISGKDAGLVRARKVARDTRTEDSAIEQVVALGFVGEPAAIDASVIELATSGGLIPVIAPIGAGEHGETFNINADTMAGALAGALGAARLLLLTDVAGVLDGNGELVPELDEQKIQALRAEGVITGGMIPKLETCLAATRDGCEAAVILDGRVPHAMLLEFFTASGAGTLVRAAENG